MARISGKIAQLGWFSGSSLSLRGKSLVPSLTNVKFKYPIVILPRTQVLLRYCRAMSDMNSTTSAVHGAAAGSAPPVMVREKISLTEKEREIFDRLLQVLRHFNLQTQLRVAGGWVRDKLLGKECYDIDIALDDMLGREFCEKVNDYLVSTGAESQGIGVIQSNPDQSKHLETARMRLFDVWIDFVNLRSEDYAENSRIPTMRFGTAEQDAYRRDLTINSLFYNINTSMVEDFTGRGMDDLRWGKIVTPLPPKETFLDDPLRVLRAIRFGARFEFEIDKAVKIAASDDDVRAAIADKISRERIGHEIDLMVSGNQPVKAMTYVCELSLFSVVFTLPPRFEPSISENQNRLCVHFIDAAWKLVRAIGSCTLNEEQRRLYLYAAMFLPYRKTIYKDTKGKTVPVVSHMFRDSLKLKASDAETVVKLHNAVEKFLSLIPLLTSDENQQVIEQVDYKGILNSVPESLKLRILVGLLLREIKDFWRAALLLSTLLHPTSIEQVVELEARGELFKKAEKAIVELGLDRVWEVKPLINGKDIMRILELKTGGPVVSEWQRKLVQWQLAYPSGTADECIDWMVRESQLKRIKT